MTCAIARCLKPTAAPRVVTVTKRSDFSTRVHWNMVYFWTFAKSLFPLSLSFFLLVSVALAAPPFAIVTSAFPFVLDGHAISSPGVTSFPLVDGDTVATSNGAAVLLFNDGSRVKLGDNSSAKLESDETRTKVVLLSGALDFKLVAGSNIFVTNLDTLRKQAVDALPAVTASPRKKSATGVASAGFILSAGGSSVGLASTLLNPLASGAKAASQAARTARPMAQLPPCSTHF